MESLPIGRLLTFALSGLPVSAASVAVFVYLPPYFSGHLGVSMALIGAVWMLIRFVDIPVDVGLALAMDRTQSRWGRYRPWALASAPLLAVAFWMLFRAPAHFGGAYLAIWLIVFYLGQSMSSLSTSAWGATLASAYHERSRLFAVQTAVGIGGAVVVLFVPVIGHGLGLSDAANVEAMGIAMAIAAPIAILLSVLLTPEPRRSWGTAPEAAIPWRDVLAVLTKPDLLRLFLSQTCLTLGPGWMSALYIFYFTQDRGFSLQQASVLLAIYILAGVPGALIAAALARRIGKHRTLMLSTTGFSLGLFSVFVIPKADMWLGAPFMTWSGAMASSFGLMIGAMLADLGDEVRLEQGRERMSLVYALNGLAGKIAAALSIGLSLPLLQALGFNPAEGAHNSPEALLRLSWAFLAGPVVFVMLGGACVIGWRMDAQRQGEIRRQLDAREREAVA
ncbi:MAG TPA: MFS transporter [Caulobacteraceae bacterium]|nr:MFS transporter [Caulobacteraceae bacterium]